MNEWLYLCLSMVLNYEFMEQGSSYCLFGMVRANQRELTHANVNTSVT